jgi:Flp pilus assembly protein TadD
VPEEGAVAEVEEVEAAPPSELPPGQLRPMERFVGWGFRDWFDVKDARPAAERKIARELEMVRRRLKIDPSDSAAINLLGYYAYLAENGDLSRDAFERLIELYPDEPTGYNNLALTYKRDKDYTREEALYRKALELEPGDTNVLNNLAVCLAHQGRYEEALKIMEDLEVSLPDDPYADLHRAKIHAEMGHELRALNYLKKSLSGVQKLDTMHHIELRQDIRLDPSFDSLRSDRRFHQIITEAYGVNAEELLRPRRRRFGG